MYNCHNNKDKQCVIWVRHTKQFFHSTVTQKVTTEVMMNLTAIINPPHLQADAVYICRSHDPDQRSENRADDGPVLGALGSRPLLLVALPDARWEQGELLPLRTLCVLVRCPQTTLLLQSQGWRDMNQIDLLFHKQLHYCTNPREWAKYRHEMIW